MDSLVKVVPGAQMVTGRRGSADSDIGAVSLGEGDRNLGPKEVLEKRRQKKKRDTAMRHFRNHRTLYETQDERTMRAEITCAALSLDRVFPTRAAPAALAGMDAPSTRAAAVNA